jgi:hypothetical protein
VERVQAIYDPRRQCRNLKHRLADILILGFCGTLAGCDDFVEVADFAWHNIDFFRTFLDLPHGIPSHDTFNRVFAVIPSATLQEVLLPWLLQRRGLPAGEWVHIDGKTMRHTRHKSAGLGALHVVSSWAGQTGLTLGQLAADAMGCQKEIARTIVEGEGGYILAAKDNQPTLSAEIGASFAKAVGKPQPARRECTTVDSGHGRQERRTVRVLPVARNLSPQPGGRAGP